MRDEKKRKGDAVYLFGFPGKVLALVYNPGKNRLATCFRVEWVLEGLPAEKISELIEWGRKRVSLRNKNGNARQ